MNAELSIGSGRLQTTLSFDGELKLVMAGKDYFDLLLRLIHGARESIHLQTYIFNDDETGVMVAEALKAAAKRNVKVHLMVDGYASQGLSKIFISELKQAGIQFRFFEPLLKSKYLYFGRRMHHKIFVVDATQALVGGINVANRYNNEREKPAWLDFALYVSGETAEQLDILCWKTWNGFSSTMQIPAFNKTGKNGNVLPANHHVLLRRNDWVRGRNEISKTYYNMLRRAGSEIIILCSYFLPGKVIRKHIVQAIQRGVKVKVIAAGTSDVMLAKHAERWLYDWLIRNGVELYEYQENVLHGKIAVCDDQWMTIGSYNINDISAYASIELNLDVFNPGFVKQVREQLERIRVQDCIPITREYHLRTKNIFIQFIRWCSYQFIRAVFHLFTFYFKKQG